MTHSGSPIFSIDIHVDNGDLAAALADDARSGLTRDPKELPPKWLYDERGSQLFDAITRLPEYYPTRREQEILTQQAAAIAALTRADTLVELGSGTSTKTRLLLDALAEVGTLRRFVPFDVSESTLRAAGTAIAGAYDGIEVRAVVGDFERHLGVLPSGGRRLVAFLGSTVGNLTPASRPAFLAEVGEGLEPGDSLLLGVDLVKDVARLEAAYNDAAGVTAEFNRNLLWVLNRQLGADFVPEAFHHVACWNPEQEWMEMRLRSVVPQVVKVPTLDLVVDFAAGEEMRTEISAKFRRPKVEAALAAAGFELAHWWTDAAGDFALTLAFRRAR